MGRDSDSDLEIVVQSSTYHNIGIIQMCLGNFQDALIAFQKAVEIRIAFFSNNHPDVAVSKPRAKSCLEYCVILLNFVADMFY